jgi:hypothetical protein
MRPGVAQGGIVSSVLFSLYVNDMPPPSGHVELPPYADVTALVATFRSPSLLVKYLEAHLCRLEHWLRDWKISINVSKITGDALHNETHPKTQANSVSPRAISVGRNGKISWGDP